MLYKHLQVKERHLLAILHQEGKSQRAIARALGRNPSTIYRELRRNMDSKMGYASLIAQDNYSNRRKASRPNNKLHYKCSLWFKVSALLNECWSPRQISHTLKRQYPQQPFLYVCPETIYKAVYAYPMGERRRYLISCLRQGFKRRRPRSRGKDRRGHIPDTQSIHVRPLDVEHRQTFGHWEGDLIKGEGNKSSVGVLVERKSRFVILCKLPDASATSVLAAFASKFSQLAQPLRKTLTYDQGKEMARHKELTEKTGMQVYFCDPHSPWQRGTCENTNGLLRQFLPKGTDLSTYTQHQLDGISRCLNNRPRQVLDWQTPYQVFGEAIKEISENFCFFSPKCHSDALDFTYCCASP